MRRRRTTMRGLWRRAVEDVSRPWLALRGRLDLFGCRLGRHVRAAGHVSVCGHQGIRIDDDTQLLRGLVPTRLIARPGATLHIGQGCILNNASRLEAHQRIEIGRDCMFGRGVVICDRDGDRVAPVTIEDAVWLAHGVRIQPGVRVGRGAVVSAGSVVVRDVPADSLAIGVPARTLPLHLVTNPEETRCP